MFDPFLYVGRRIWNRWAPWAGDGVGRKGTERKGSNIRGQAVGTPSSARASTPAHIWSVPNILTVIKRLFPYIMLLCFMRS